MGGTNSTGASSVDSTIHVVAGRGDLAAVRHFVEKKGVGVNTRVVSAVNVEWTPLHLACRSNRLEVVRYLISKGADVNAVAYNKTPLTAACYRGFAELATLLLQLGADVKYETPERESALTIALSYRRTHVIRAVLAQYSSTDPDFVWALLRAQHRGKTLFQRADTAEIAQVLLEQSHQDDQLSPVCHEMLTIRNGAGLTRLEETRGSIDKLKNQTWFNMREILRLGNLVKYLSSFEDLPLAVPESISVSSRAGSKRRKVHGRIAVKPNPGLSEFQLSVAKETLAFVLKTLFVPDNVAYGILGYLSPVDVMRRSSGSQTPVVASGGGFQQVSTGNPCCLHRLCMP